MSEQEINMEPKAEETTQNEEPLAPAPEPIRSEMPEEENTRVDPKEELIQQIKTCVIDGDSCKGLGDKLRSTAEELGVSVEDLIDEVFDQLACQ